MVRLLRSRYFYISIALVVVILIILMAFGVTSKKEEPLVSTTVEIGTVRELVSVSGIAEAEQTAELSFPVTGLVKTVHVNIGEEVKEGDLLVSLVTEALRADRQDAVAALTKTIADRDELLEGPTLSARDVSAENILSRQEALKKTIENENQKVLNAYLTLLSSGLTAFSDDPDEAALPPVITGTYSCDEEGSYFIETYMSGANSGYSFRLSGLETGTYVVSVDQPTPLGDCGLRIQFNSNSKYNSTDWTVNIPNMKSSQYVINRNAYSLALTQRESAISASRQALTLSEAEATDQNSPARSQVIKRANASIAQARARLAKIDSTINDRILTAPFSGTVTEIEILPGEAVTNAPVITLLASKDFEVTARIPEIDIGKIVTGQTVEMVFDARDDEVISGKTGFVSLRATEIDGVAYYEAIIELDEKPNWIRSGLNADVDIVIREETDVMRLPKRFVTLGDIATVLTTDLTSGTTASSTVEILMEGNDGYVAIIGLNEGDTVLAP